MATSIPASPSAMTPMDSILPRTVRARHCGFEDAVRYFGGSVSFIGASYCYSYQMTIPGILLTTTGVSIVVVHIVSKTFGTWAKAARAGERVIESYNILLRAANQTTTKLGKIEEEGKKNEVALAIETQALLRSTEEIDQSTSGTKKNIETLQKEYATLRSSNTELQQIIKSQKTLIQSMEQDVEKFSTQNNLYQRETEGLTRMVSTLRHTDEKFAEQTASATTKFQEGVDNFAGKLQDLHVIGQLVKEMHEQNLLLQQRIEELQQTKENLEQTLSSITTAQHKNHENNTELSTLASKLETNKAEFITTQEKIHQELSEWKKILENRATKDVKK